MSHRRPHRRRLVSDAGHETISIRVGSSRSSTKYHQILARGPQDARPFARLVDDQTRAHPKDPLIIAVNGFRPWLGDVLHSCIEDYWSDIPDLDRAVQFGSTMQFPERASKRGQYVPWTFIIDHMNVPQVYYWSVGMNPPVWEDSGLPSMENFRFRTGVWFCARGACRSDSQISVTVIFTRPDEISEHVVKDLLFDYLWHDEDFTQPHEDEEGLCWTFSRLYWLLTDWQNIIGEVLARLDEAEANSHGRHLPVKARTRRMHAEVDRLYEMKDYLQFHTRAFKKLQKLKESVPRNGQVDPLWADMDDAVEDLEQFDSRLDSLRERFNNLIELEFNITNAVQADNSAFLSAVATLVLPISFLASLFGITTVTWPVIWYLYAAVPIFVVSAAFTAVSPWARRRLQVALYPLEERRLRLRRNQFTLLGEELPDNVDVPNANRQGRFKHRRSMTAPLDGFGTRSASRKRSEKST
ncbi:hypothetical protein CLAFUW4_01066 [Fulvia fulva]|nr:hypothetical protein CLAFUR4_01067 [Fulvia fulva]WPV08133.1 hypothetical protein CLAFUW4_01066 [Fulvia fulva]WPV23333.1 hypothetical protein CLAFUW7_01071 [Fulvia fulva]